MIKKRILLTLILCITISPEIAIAGSKCPDLMGDWQCNNRWITLSENEGFHITEDSSTWHIEHQDGCLLYGNVDGCPFVGMINGRKVTLTHSPSCSDVEVTEGKIKGNKKIQFEGMKSGNAMGSGRAKRMSGMGPGMEDGMEDGMGNGMMESEFY